LAEKAELTSKTIGEIERGDRTSYEASTLAAVEQALEWPAGHIRALLFRPRPSSPLARLDADEVAKAMTDYLAARMPPGADIGAMVSTVLSEWSGSSVEKRAPARGASRGRSDLAEVRRDLAELREWLARIDATLQQLLARSGGPPE
jgi:hypothetical protein